MVERECVATDSQDSFRMTVSDGGEGVVSELTHKILSSRSGVSQLTHKVLSEGLCQRMERECVETDSQVPSK